MGWHERDRSVGGITAAGWMNTTVGARERPQYCHLMGYRIRFLVAAEPQGCRKNRTSFLKNNYVLIDFENVQPKTWRF